MGASEADDLPTPGAGRRAEVVVNGEPHPVAAGTTVADLVSSWCRSPKGIAVARNREVVPRSEWATTALVAADVVEIVAAAAGG